MVRERLVLIWILVQRDYTLQFAGSLLGIFWMWIQNLTLILLYSLIFLVLNLKNTPSPAEQEKFIGYMFSGLLFWIPIQEYLAKGTSILTDNRQLIKRSTLGAGIFFWIPYVQFLIHYLVTSLPVGIILVHYENLNPFGYIFSFFWMAGVGIFILLGINYLGRLNIILKDILPLVRLISQVLFWTLPILYYPSGILEKLNRWNPLNYPLDVFRFLLLKDTEIRFSFAEFLLYFLLFFLIFLFSRKKFHRLVMDHL